MSKQNKTVAMVEVMAFDAVAAKYVIYMCADKTFAFGRQDSASKKRTIFANKFDAFSTVLSYATGYVDGLSGKWYVCKEAAEFHGTFEEKYTIEQIIQIHLRASGPCSMQSVIDYVRAQFDESATDQYVLIAMKQLMIAGNVDFYDHESYQWTGKCD